MTYSLEKNNPIGIRQFVGRWYLFWRDNNQTICSFASQLEAYSARRSILESL
jgi:hypothetical protein